MKHVGPGAVVRSSVALVAGIVFAAGGCVRKPPAALQPPRVGMSASQFVGTALSGPRPAPAAVAATPAVVVDVEWFALQRMPAAGTKGLTPLGAAARLVVATRDRQPVRPTSRLTANAQWATGESAVTLVKSLRDETLAGQTASMSSAHVAIPINTTASLRATADGSSDPDAAPAVELFVQHLPAAGAAAVNSPKPGPIEIGLSVQDYVATAEVPEAAMNVAAEPQAAKKRRAGRPATQLSQAPPTSLVRELAILPPLDAASGESVALIVMPSRFDGTASRAMAAVVRASPAADDPATQKLLAAAVADVRQRSGAGAATRPTSTPWPEFQSAIAMLDRADVRRRTLVYLASQSGARLCEDVALVADDATLQQLATDVRARVAAATPPFTSASLGWTLDRTCLEWAARLSGENRLPSEMSGVLSAYAGEAGRRPASLEEMLKSGADSHAALEARLVSENVIYLDDSSPAARVRALAWLADRGRAPAGYDPLAPARQRRDALERALQSAATRPAP